MLNNNNFEILGQHMILHCEKENLTDAFREI